MGQIVETEKPNFLKAKIQAELKRYEDKLNEGDKEK